MFNTKQESHSKGGNMGTMIRTKDWSATPVGPMTSWPVDLRLTLRILLNSRFPMFLFWGKELTCFYNDAFSYGLGLEGKDPDFLGKNGSLLLSKTWPSILPIIDKLMVNGEASWHEDQLFSIDRDGNRENTYWTSSYSPVSDETGKFEGILVTLNEATEKVEARIKREEAEERSRLASEIAGIASWDLDLQTHEMMHSENFATIFGHPETVRLTYSQIMDQLHPDDLINIVEKAFEQAMQTGTYKYEARMIKRNGELRWIRSHGKIFFDDTNEPLKIIGTLIDSTEERNRREMIMESELKFRLLADSLPQLIWTADSLGSLNYGNLSFFTYTGLNQVHIDKEGWLKLIHPNELEQYKSVWAKAIDNNNDFLFEHRLLQHDGQYRWHISRATPQKDSAGMIQWVGTSTDIQQQKTFTELLEKQVNERTVELERNNINLVKINIELQSFVYVSSHDLQEPLRKIQTFISRLYDTEKIHFTSITKDYFERINVAAKRMQDLIQDLLTYSRTNASDKVLVLSDLQELAEEVKEDYREIIRETHAVVHIYDLFEVKVIPFQFKQLLNNLLGNALKFTKPHTAARIEIKAQHVQGETIKALGANPLLTYCHISVADNGIGFSMEYKERIFEVFQRLHSKQDYTGTGIGLAIVKKIVENHEGFLSVTGELNKGAVFNIYIPEL